MPNNNLSLGSQARDHDKEKQRQQELFAVFQEMDIFALSRLLIAAKLPHFSKWLKQATILTMADSIPADTPNYYQTLADKASQTLRQEITVSMAKNTLFTHAGLFSGQKKNHHLKNQT